MIVILCALSGASFRFVLVLPKFCLLFHWCVVHCCLCLCWLLSVAAIFAGVVTCLIRWGYCYHWVIWGLLWLLVVLCSWYCYLCFANFICCFCYVVAIVVNFIVVVLALLFIFIVHIGSNLKPSTRALEQSWLSWRNAVKNACANLACILCNWSWIRPLWVSWFHQSWLIFQLDHQHCCGGHLDNSFGVAWNKKSLYVWLNIVLERLQPVDGTPWLSFHKGDLEANAARGSRWAVWDDALQFLIQHAS